VLQFAHKAIDLPLLTGGGSGLAEQTFRRTPTFWLGCLASPRLDAPRGCLGAPLHSPPLAGTPILIRPKSMAEDTSVRGRELQPAAIASLSAADEAQFARLRPEVKTAGGPPSL